MTVRFLGLRKGFRRSSLLRFSRKICRAVKLLRVDGEVCVNFVRDREIRKVNRGFLGKDRPTDIIAFRYPRPDALVNGRCRVRSGQLPSRDAPFGDIYVSVDTARAQAQRGGHNLTQELALLILHGLLHLLGYEDTTVDKRKRMFREQARLFRKIEPGLAPPDFRGPFNAGG